MDEDYAAMFNANVDANIMLMKQKKIILDQDAEIERLREALKPFAEVLKGHWSHQSDDMVLSVGFGDDKRLELRLGDFRLARSALQQTQPSHAQMSDDKGQR